MFTKHYVEDCFSPERAEALYNFAKSTGKLLLWVERCRHLPPRSRKISLYDLVNEGIYSAMPRTRRTQPKPDAKRFDQATPPKDRNVVWANIRLSDDDVAYLTEHTLTAEMAGAMLIAVADRGYGFSVKSMDDGETIMCAIIGFVDDAPERTMGVSAFSASVIDATHACLYKFEQLCGGSFRSELGSANTNRPRFR